MNFADLKSLTIPEGTVTKITVGSTVLWQAVTEYTITQYLSDVSSSNSATKVTEGSSFTATLTTGTGYYLYPINVSVKMGGKDITDTACSWSFASADKLSCTISIAKVTGNIIITADGYDYINYLWGSTDENGDIFYDSGYGYGEEELDGTWYYVTGFIPLTSSETINFNNMEVYDGDKLVFYNSSKTELATLTVNTSDSYGRFLSSEGCVYSYNNSKPFFDSGTNTSAFGNTRYVRVYCYYITDDSEITKD